MGDDILCVCDHGFFEHEDDDDSFLAACLYCDCDNYEPAADD